MQVLRTEVSQLFENNSWVLVYGRRKTGKTYILRNLIEYDLYFHVRSDGSITGSDMGKDILPEQLAGIISVPLRNGEVVVVDEFQRLPDHFFDDISLSHPDGKLILTGSSMKFVNKMMSRNSPLLGLLFPVHISTIDPVDILKCLSKEFSPERSIELAPFLQDPWTIPIMEGNFNMESFIQTLKYIVPGLIGEVFTNEEKELSRTYEAILTLMGSGIHDVGKIANILYTRGVISNPGSNYVFPYIKNMQKMGLIRQDRYFKGKKNRYSLVSAPMELFHYLNSRYDLEIRQFSYNEISTTVDKFINLSVERFIGDLLAKIYDGRIELIKSHDMEIDVMITKRNKPFLIAEIKWGKAKLKDIINFQEKVDSFNCRKIFISKDKIEYDGIETMTPEDVISLAIKT
jgi:hypothetical protein